jgi:small-conductance mechanosensitive channel
MYIAYGVKKSAQNFTWSALVLGVWLVLFNGHDITEYVKYVSYTLYCIQAYTAMKVVKISCVKLIANSFHTSAYFERIEEALFEQYVLEKLSVPSYSQARLGGTSIRIGSANNEDKERKLLDAVSSKAVSSLAFNNILRFVRHTNIRSVSTQHGEIKTAEQAEYVGKEIFMNVAPQDSPTLCHEDLCRFLDEKDVDRVLQGIESNEDGRVTLPAFIDWVREVVRERKYLSMTLSDTKTAIKSLDDLLDYLVAILLIMLIMIFCKVDLAKLLVLASSSILAAVFVFGNTCKTVFEAIIFLFMVHPYDTGDIIVVHGNRYQVEEMQLLTTILLSTSDNSKVYISNAKLAQAEIINQYRSPDMIEVLEFQVLASTPGDKIYALRNQVARFASADPDHWHPKVILSIMELAGPRMVVHISIQMKMNFCKGDVRFGYRSRLMLHVTKVMSELGILPNTELSVRLLGAPT